MAGGDEIRKMFAEMFVWQYPNYKCSDDDAIDKMLDRAISPAFSDQIPTQQQKHLLYFLD